jgi:hypothetical protein
VSIIRQFVTAGVAKHVSMSFDFQVRGDSCPFDHAGEAGRRKGRTSLRNEHERRFRALTLMATQRAQLATCQGMGAGGAVLEAPDMEARGFEVDLFPRKSQTSAARRPCLKARSTIRASR